MKSGRDNLAFNFRSKSEHFVDPTKSLKKQLKLLVKTLSIAGAEDIIALDIHKISDLASFIIICSSRSEKHSEGILRKSKMISKDKLIFAR